MRNRRVQSDRRSNWRRATDSQAHAEPCAALVLFVAAVREAIQLDDDWDMGDTRLMLEQIELALSDLDAQWSPTPS